MDEVLAFQSPLAIMKKKKTERYAIQIVNQDTLGMGQFVGRIVHQASLTLELSANMVLAMTMEQDMWLGMKKFVIMKVMGLDALNVD